MGIAGLTTVLEYVLKNNVGIIFHQLQHETNWVIDELSHIEIVTVYSKGGENQGPVISFNINGLLPSDVGYILQNSYDITVRTGLHCAPLIHQQFGLSEYGSVRVSISHFTKHEELQIFINAIREITLSL